MMKNPKDRRNCMERSTNIASAGLNNCFKTFFDTSIQLFHDVSLAARTRIEVCKWTVRENFKHWCLAMTIWQLVVMVRKKCKQAVETGIAVRKLYYDVIRSETLYLTIKLVPYLKPYILIIYPQNQPLITFALMHAEHIVYSVFCKRFT